MLFFCRTYVHIRGSYFHLCNVTTFLLAVSQREFLCIYWLCTVFFLAHIHCRILAFLANVFCCKTTLNKSYLILLYFLLLNLVLSYLVHPTNDDVIKWKHFPRYWPFVWGTHWSPVNSPHKDAELWCFLWFAPEQTIQQTIEKPVIWDAITLIMTSQ